MATQQQYAWRRDREGLGVWAHRGKVAVAGYGHSPVDRRWDGTSMDKTLGAYTILACQRAMDGAGVTPDQIDGVLCCPEPIAGASGGSVSNWAPRPYFAPPYDSEWGLTRVNAAWLIKQMGLPNVTYAPANVPSIGLMMGLAAQSVADGLCTTCLVMYPTGNLEGRYRRGGENAEDYAAGARQWTVPRGNHGGNDFINIFPHAQYCRKYGGTHDDLAPFVVNQHKNGLLTPWGYNATHGLPQLTVEDYVTSRYILRPMRIWDCDRPVNASAAYLFTTAERARDMKQRPIYILNHTQHEARQRSTQASLDEIEAETDRAARMMWEGSGLGPQDVDIFNPYDGYSTMTQFWLEAFQWHGVQRGETYAFYADDITVGGPHPFNSSGGNLGNGRTRTAMWTDCLEQLRGTAGPRQVRVRAETALAGFGPPLGGGWLMFASTPARHLPGAEQHVGHEARFVVHNRHDAERLVQQPSRSSRTQEELMDLQLTDKKAIVTGASRGIGRAIARQLALEGCDVAICARTEGPLKQAAAALANESGRKVVPIVCDTLNADAIKHFVHTAVRELGGIHIVINNAARVGGTPGTVETVSDADVLRDFEEKVVGYLRTVQAAVPYLKQAGWGRVINISGGAGRAPGMAVSGGIRNIGTVNLTKSMANALGPYGINVNAIYPGQTITEATLARYAEQAQREGTTVEALHKAADERTVLKHVVTATDIGYFVAMLCSPLAIGVHGEAIGIDGGNRADMHY